MPREVRAEVVVPVESLYDARREEARRELGQLHAAVRGERGRLQDEGVPGQQGGAHLAAREEEGVVPGDDADDNADGRVPDGDLALGRVLADLLGEGQVAEALEEVQAPGDFVAGPQGLHGSEVSESGSSASKQRGYWATDRFPLLLVQHADEFLRVRLQGLDEALERLLALVPGDLGPLLRRLLRGCHRLVDVL